MRPGFLSKIEGWSWFAMTVVAALLAQSMDAAAERADFCTWEKSDDSVYCEGDQLVIDSDGGWDDWAKKAFSIDLTAGASVIIEQRVKLESGGRNYRLPYQHVTFEDASFLRVTYLFDYPPSSYGGHHHHS